MSTVFDIHQNEALSCCALHAFTTSFVSKQISQTGASLALYYTVLPITYDLEAASELQGMKLDAAGLHRFLAANRTMVLDLPRRIRAFYNRTNASLNMAFATGLLSLDTNDMKVFPIRKTPPKFESPESKVVIAAAQRLGAWYAPYEVETVLRLLNTTI